MASPSSPLPDKAADTTAERPWPVRVLSLKIADYVDRMSVLWVEGQVVQVNRRPGAAMAFLTLRDPDVDMSLSVGMRVTALDAMQRPVTQGERVVIQAKPTFWPQRGTLSLDGRQIRPVGIGELLARIAYLKQTLLSEGLFDAARKKPLPFLPRRVGLISGRASAAERDVVENARRRWPGIALEVRAVAVQGPSAVADVCAALAELDALPDVDVIVIARGGGSVEDLLPFSNETLIRAVAAASTPVISAIGHDVDAPLLDYVADARASTPTEAATLVVPDALRERGIIDRGRRAVRGHALGIVQRERRRIEDLQGRPVLTDRTAYVRGQRAELATMTRRARLRLEAALHRHRDFVGHLRSQARVLSPQATLDRGYAIVSTPEGNVILDQTEVAVGDLLRVRVARGDFAVRATDG